MAETTPTQRSAHLIQGNSSASRPGAHMPVTFEGDEPDWTAVTWPAKAWGWLALAVVSLVLFVFCLVFTAAAILRKFGFV